ncbi:MAG: LysE family transporter [Bacteroidota bacterium]
MQLLLQGIVVGLGLSILVGPILVTILDASLEKGKWAGLLVGLGIWTSDFLFILTTYFGMTRIIILVDNSNFEWITGLLGGTILIGFGIVIWLSKPIDVQAEMERQNSRFAPIQYFLKGFLVNTFNPFTFVFWIGLSSTVTVNANYSSQEAFLYYSGILGALVATDSAKALLAAYIGKMLSLKKIILMKRIAGSMLILFGIGLIIRVL